MFHGLDQHTLTPFIKAGFPKAVSKIRIVSIWNLSLFLISMTLPYFEGQDL